MSRNNKVAKTPAKKEKIQCIFHRFYIVYVHIYSVSEQEHPFSVQEQAEILQNWGGRGKKPSF
jgi:hypothetical protein